MDLHIKQKQQQKPETEKQKLGDLAESHALKVIKKAGLKALTTNFLCKSGEIDIIAMDKQTLVFIEVRYRKNDHFGSPLATVTASKQRKISFAAQYFLSLNTHLQQYPCRFDVIGITPKGGAPQKNTKELDTQWVTDAFMMT